MDEERKLTSMSRFYLHSMRPVLARQVQEMMDSVAPEQLTAVHEELAVARVAAGKVVEMFGVTLEGEAADEVAVPVAIQTVDMMQQVTKIAQAAAQIDNARAQLRGAMVVALENMVQRIAQAAYRAFGNDHRVVEFVEDMREQLQLEAEQGGVQGTTLLPSGEDVREQALAMDQTVPMEV